LRALLEDLPRGTDVAVIVRASAVEDLVLRDEVATLVARRGGQLHEVLGSRERVRFDADLLRRLVPDIAAREVYICGPDGFRDNIVDAASRLGVTEEQIHQEAFGF
jgi:ferredoxin-NADP reductase